MIVRVVGMETPACPRCNSQKLLKFLYDVHGVEVWQCLPCTGYFNVERIAEASDA